MSTTLEFGPTHAPAVLQNPWRKPRVLQGITIAYLLWSILPVVIAVIFLVQRRPFADRLAGLLDAVVDGRPHRLDPPRPADAGGARPDHRLAILVVLISVPIGTLFAIGIDRWHGRPARGANFVMLLSFVVPEIILGTSLFILLTTLLKFVDLGTQAQTLGLAVFQVSYPAVIVRARLHDRPEYEEAAMDLGAMPNQAIRRVLLPLIAPAILASVALVFADVVDDFVTVNALSGAATARRWHRRSTRPRGPTPRSTPLPSCWSPPC